ncbi:hypothetical protein RN629_07160 [Sphingomonadaceae bacterium jetA1]|jgi:hypothetical protein|uniref:hypothetical protein n=1 Tax=Facivitalis istanbulensis TaxID=3075838 RepID=UPI0034883323
MMWGGPGFVLTIIAMSMIGWVMTTWIRARHGYSLDNEWGVTVAKPGMADERKVELLTAENQKLVGQLSRLEERIAVLERIATDPAERTAREIDALRDR